MCRALRQLSLLLLLCRAAFGGPENALAQEPAADSVYTDTGTMVSEATPIEGEYVAPESPVVYNTSRPDERQWRQATSGKAYGYRDKQEYIPKVEKPPKIPWIVRAFINILNFFNSPLGQIMLWSVLVAIVGYVAYRIWKGQASGIFSTADRSGADDGLELTEQGLLSQDWEALMQEALRAGDVRTAIRYSYLRLLQLLQERGFIAYRADKTNADYYRELADKPQRQPFRTVTRQYEWAWYGNVLPEKAAMDSYLITFQQLTGSLRTS